MKTSGVAHQLYLSRLMEVRIIGTGGSCESANSGP